MTAPPKNKPPIDALLEIMAQPSDRERGRWDREQNFSRQSLTIDEAHEIVDAIERGEKAAT
jgi:NTP pyrophosphatase (non-canonical NTP hydrolase)